jgi:hypothetical protein
VKLPLGFWRLNLVSKSVGTKQIVGTHYVSLALLYNSFVGLGLSSWKNEETYSSGRLVSTSKSTRKQQYESSLL